jgi:hypothetical protein
MAYQRQGVVVVVHSHDRWMFARKKERSKLKRACVGKREKEKETETVFSI